MVHIERSNQLNTWICCVPCYWLRHSKAVHKAFLTFAMLLVTSLLVTSPVLFLITTLPEGEHLRDCSTLDESCHRKRDGQERVCESFACREASRRMLSSMQRDIDPCKDFYQFACGSFQTHEPTSSFSLLQKQVDSQIQRMLSNETGRISGAFIKLGQFYNNCLEFKEKPVNFAPVYRLLDELGGYILPENEGPADITPLIASLLKISSTPLLDMYLDTDLYDHSKTAIFLDLPKNYQSDMLFSNPIENESRFRRGLYIASEARRRKRSNLTESKVYKIIKNSKEEKHSQRIQKIIQSLIPSDMEQKERLSEIDELLQFCLTIKKSYPRYRDIYNWIEIDQRIYVPYNLSYLQESFEYIRWEMLVNSTLDNAGTDMYNNDYRHEYNNNQPAYIYVSAPHYFHTLGKILNRFSKRIIHNGLLVLYTTDILYDIVNVTASKNWSENCVQLTKNVFSEGIGMLYVQQYNPDFLELLINRVSILFERIKETLAERMLIMPWLDEQTRTQAIVKLHSLYGKFQIWPGYLNESLLVQQMIKVKIDHDDFLSTVLRRYKQLRRLDGQINKNTIQKGHHPFAVSAYYEASSNSIVISLAMMTMWSWSWNGGPTYDVYATLGSVISHEVLHAFDLHHRQLPLDLDPVSTQWSWITPESWHKLQVMIECVAKLYARSFWRKVKLYGNSVDIQYDWNITRNENVADIGALQIAYQTWYILTNGKDRILPGLEALHPNQLFFIRAAQTYCSNITAEAYILSIELDYHIPQPERINGIMMNSPEFAEAFRCSLGSKMNPIKKCKMW
ncbi:PREDICTED: neprilysin-21 [Ceratosolen solmsi marchali]|uniref:Neprilysin-21 n=1 Tax=Ceratosolen solmsi marchali TaxID=326594 RepID=A0AAJ6YMV1_9HYME|nr:PREDICTED: neprilysin-21 [Ceratosolen solmsi marchali]